MRKIIGGVFQSLDGIMQAPGGPPEDPTGGFDLGGWTATFWDEKMGAAMGGIFSAPYDLLLGRKTYEIFAAHCSENIKHARVEHFPRPHLVLDHVLPGDLGTAQHG